MLISLAEYAEKHGKHPDNIRQRILRGTLPAIKIGRNWCIESETPIDNGKKTAHKKGPAE